MNLSKLPTATLNRNHAGFSLIELAVVLMIVGILMSGVLVSISQTTLSARRTAALAQLQQVEEALYGFAESQGRLPCPASTTSKGYEDCTYAHGFVPSATLGIYGQVNNDIEVLLVDPWQNPLRYSVVKTGTDNPDFSLKTSIQAFFTAGTLVKSSPGGTLQVCSNSNPDGSCSGTPLTDTAAAVIMTMGENWASYTSTNETTNASTSAHTLGGYRVHADGEQIFVSTDYSEDNFDDQLVWLSPYVLFNRMVSAGKLP